MPHSGCSRGRGIPYALGFRGIRCSDHRHSPRSSLLCWRWRAGLRCWWRWCSLWWRSPRWRGWPPVQPVALWLAWAVRWWRPWEASITPRWAHFIPCTLCWYQRIAMYPLAIRLEDAAGTGTVDLAVRGHGCVHRPGVWIYHASSSGSPISTPGFALRTCRAARPTSPSSGPSGSTLWRGSGFPSSSCYCWWPGTIRPPSPGDPCMTTPRSRCDSAAPQPSRCY